MRHSAYWISPRGRIIPIGGSIVSHIGAVLKDPRCFGLARKNIIAAYRRHREPLGFEGRARQEVMLGLLLKGWIRIRFRPRMHGFMAQTWRLTPDAVRRLRRWARQITSGGLDRLDPKGFIVELSTAGSQESRRIALEALLVKRPRATARPRVQRRLLGNGGGGR